MKHIIQKLPIVGPRIRSSVHALRNLGRKLRKQERSYIFKRKDTQGEMQPDLFRVTNLLNYTKTSESAYSGDVFPAGYHSINLSGLDLQGQRNPQDRIKLVPIDFSGKTVLDIGCNQGGMLFSISDKIAHGVGIDFDSRLINAANKIRSHAHAANLDFYVFNLEREPLDLISDFLPVEKVDVVFLLAVCMWIENWKEVIQFAHQISHSLLFESNGKQEQQLEQLEYLKSVYGSVQLLSENSQEDSLQRNRKLYFCS